jgi:hypothetical protein
VGLEHFSSPSLAQISFYHWEFFLGGIFGLGELKGVKVEPRREKVRSGDFGFSQGLGDNC